MKRKDGAKNLFELTKKEKDVILSSYYNDGMTCSEMTKCFNLTKRTMHDLLEEAHIHSKRKNRYTLDEDYFSQIDSERKAYWLGFLYADGYVGDDEYNNIVFSQSKDKAEAVINFAKDIAFTGNLRINQKGGSFEGTPATIINFSSKKMASDLRKLGLFPNKSMLMEKFPVIDDVYIRHFIRGYFDGDGSISRNSRNRVNKNGTKSYSYKMSIIGTEKFVNIIGEHLPVDSYLIRPSKSPEMSYLWVNHMYDMPTLYSFLYDDATEFLKVKHNIWQKILGDIDERSSIENGINPQGVSA